jgi:hypothetical protein
LISAKKSPIHFTALLDVTERGGQQKADAKPNRNAVNWRSRRLPRSVVALNFPQEAVMARYYFNVVTPTETIDDPEGAELPSLEQARGEAIEDARQLMASAMLAGHDISTRRIEIINDLGVLLMVIPFAEAYTRER